MKVDDRSTAGKSGKHLIIGDLTMDTPLRNRLLAFRAKLDDGITFKSQRNMRVDDYSTVGKRGEHVYHPYSEHGGCSGMC